MSVTDNITPTPGEGPRNADGAPKANNVIPTPGEGGRNAASMRAVFSDFTDSLGSALVMSTDIAGFTVGGSAYMQALAGLPPAVAAIDGRTVPVLAVNAPDNIALALDLSTAGDLTGLRAYAQAIDPL